VGVALGVAADLVAAVSAAAARADKEWIFRVREYRSNGNET